MGRGKKGGSLFLLCKVQVYNLRVVIIITLKSTKDFTYIILFNSHSNRMIFYGDVCGSFGIRYES